MLERIYTNCVSSNALSNDKNMVKIRIECNKRLNNIRNKNKKPIAKHVYQNNKVQKIERTVINGRFGCGKIFLMLSVLKDKYPDNFFIICKTDNQYPSKYHNQPSDILPLE